MSKQQNPKTTSWTTDVDFQVSWVINPKVWNGCGMATEVGLKKHIKDERAREREREGWRRMSRNRIICVGREIQGSRPRQR